MNILEVKPTISEVDNNTYIIKFIIKIDDNEPITYHDVAIFNIIDFLNPKSSSSSYLWTCDCGNPDCAGLVDFPIKHVKNNIELTLYEPVVYNKEWDNSHNTTLLIFSKKDIFNMLWELSFEIENIINENNKILLNYNVGTFDHIGVVYNLPNTIRTRLTQYKFLYPIEEELILKKPHFKK